MCIQGRKSARKITTRCADTETFIFVLRERAYMYDVERVGVFQAVVFTRRGERYV